MADSSSKESEIEQEVFCCYFTKLVTSTQYSILDISNMCLASHLITRDVHNDVIYASPIPQVKATKLLTAIMDCIEHQNASKCFETFLKILEELLIFDDLIKEMRHSLKLSRQSLKTTQSKNQSNIL